MLNNLVEYSKKFIIREYHLKTDGYPQKYIDNWLMNMYTKDELSCFFTELDFKMTYFEEHYNEALEPTLDLWLHNLDKVDNIEKTEHIKLLELSARYLKQNKEQILKDIGLSTFIFERHD